MNSTDELTKTGKKYLEEGKFHKKKHFVYEDIDKVKRNLRKLKLKNTGTEGWNV